MDALYNGVAVHSPSAKEGRTPRFGGAESGERADLQVTLGLASAGYFVPSFLPLPCPVSLSLFLGTESTCKQPMYTFTPSLANPCSVLRLKR
jgi:hypothetical protein